MRYDRRVSSGPIELKDASGVVRFKGTSTPAPGAAGVQAVYGGDVVSVPDGATFAMPFTTLISGTELLDRSTPDAVTVLAAGTYALTVSIYGDALTAAGYAVVEIDAIGVNPMVSGHTQSPAKQWGVTAVFVAAASDPVAVLVSNFDGVSARDFNLASAVLVKL